MREETVRIGVDLGGTKIEAIAIDGAGHEISRKRVATPRDDYKGTVKSIVSLVAELERELGTPNATVGIGTPGALSRKTGLIKNSNSTWLIGKPLDHDLEEALGRPVRMANDANCFALSEATDGAAEGAAIVFGVILGTGVGGGVIFNGKVMDGPNAIGGEWGHNQLPWPNEDELPGRQCYCGLSGCIETYLSGRGLGWDYERHTGRMASGAEVAELALKHTEPDAIRAIERYEHRLARGLAMVINVIDPDVIVLGGGVSNLARLYENVPKLWEQFVFSDLVETKLVRAIYGDASGVRGAAWLW